MRQTESTAELYDDELVPLAFLQEILQFPRSPGTHIPGPWVIDSISLYRDLRTGTQYIGTWASRDCKFENFLQPAPVDPEVPLGAAVGARKKELASHSLTFA